MERCAGRRVQEGEDNHGDCLTLTLSGRFHVGNGRVRQEDDRLGYHRLYHYRRRLFQFSRVAVTVSSRWGTQKKGPATMSLARYEHSVAFLVWNLKGVQVSCSHKLEGCYILQNNTTTQILYFVLQ